MYRIQINPAKLTKYTGKLLAELIAKNPGEMIFEAGDYQVGSTDIELTNSITGYQCKHNPNEVRFAVSDSNPLIGGVNNIHVSNATVKIVNGSAVSKQKSPDKERIVKRPKNNMEIVREAAFLSELSMFGYGNKKVVPDNDQRAGALVMRRIKGKDLYEHLAEVTKFSADQMIELTVMMAEAVEIIHAKGIIYRDIKPENFMVELDKDNNPIRVVPLDFDLSKFKDETGVVERNIGTRKPVDYRAPEIKLNHDAYSNEKSDAYSFTVMLDKIIWRHGLFQKFDGLNRTETKSIKRVIKRGLEKKDGKRATVGEIAQEFKEIQKSRSLK